MFHLLARERGWPAYTRSLRFRWPVSWYQFYLRLTSWRAQDSVVVFSAQSPTPPIFSWRWWCSAPLQKVAISAYQDLSKWGISQFYTCRKLAFVKCLELRKISVAKARIETVIYNSICLSLPEIMLLPHIAFAQNSTISIRNYTGIPQTHSSCVLQYAINSQRTVLSAQWMW